MTDIIYPYNSGSMILYSKYKKILSAY